MSMTAASILTARKQPAAVRTEPLYLDIYPLLARHLTGIGRFVARLVESLARLAPLRLITTIGGKQARSMNLSGLLLCGQEIRVGGDVLSSADGDVAGWARRLCRQPRYSHDERQARNSPGIFTSLRPQERHFRRELGILYDFTPLLLPWTHTPGTRRQYEDFFADHTQRFDKALAISEATRFDAGWLCALPQDDVVVGYPGPSLCVHGHANAKPVARSEQMLLVVSTREPRKNAQFLVDWFLHTHVLQPDAELYWVGPSGWLWDICPRPAGRRSRGRVIRFLGMVPDRRLCELYQQAACTVYPSLYEGFGFPVLDSLRHGAPVLCSLNSSLQEFAGPGVFYFDPCVPDSLDDAYRDMTAALPVAIDRSALDRRFSWDNLAQTVISLCA
jgi:glycosyltransferase involved in cell wall biosynthesis